MGEPTGVTADDPASAIDAERAAVDLLRRRVLNVVGHELRTPVTTLRGLAELLGTMEDPARTEQVHDAIRRAARRIEALLDDALVALGVSTALPVGAPEPTDVRTVAEAAWAAAGVEHELDAGGDGVAMVHPDGFRRALTCVLDNAVKYGEDVHLTISSEPGHVVITVSDDGPGFREGEAPLLFEPFFRGERAVMTAPGLGLGLTVARQLLEHDGGSVDLQPRPGSPGGAVATVRVPVAP